MTFCTRSKLRTAKRLWGMFFALDNAAEYGHWVVDDKASWCLQQQLSWCEAMAGPMWLNVPSVLKLFRGEKHFQEQLQYCSR